MPKVLTEYHCDGDNWKYVNDNSCNVFVSHREVVDTIYINKLITVAAKCR